MKILPVIILILLFSIKTAAQTDTLNIPDTTSVNIPDLRQKWYQSQYVQESIIPVSLALGSVAIITIPGLKNDLQKVFSWNATHKINLSLDQKQNDYLLEDQIRYAPTVAAYALSFCGLKSKHRFIDRSVILVISYIASDFVVNNGKNLTRSLRPGRNITSIDSYSLPSQHTAMAFIAATFLDHELGYISPWISVGGYAAATWVGIARIANNDHWVSDVLMGAAVGILMTDATYWAYDGVMKLFPKRLAISPIVSSQQTGLYFCYKF
jgi:membrane-associated phospholipid phosphatase